MSETITNQKTQTATKEKSDWRKMCGGYGDKLEAIWFGIILLWGGAVALLTAGGYAATISWWDGGAVFFTGAGVITILALMNRNNNPAYAPPEKISYIFALFLLLLGVDGLTGWALFWPVMLVIVGGSILHDAFGKNS